MTKVLVIALDNMRALMHRRMLLALMIGVFIITAIFYFGIGQVAQSIETAETPATATESTEEISQPALTETQQAQQDQAAQSQIAQLLSVFYSFSAFGGILVGIYIGASAVSNEISKGSIAMVLSRPVARWQFLLGKYIGAVTILLGYSVLIGGAMTLYTQAHQLDAIPAIRYAPWLTFCYCLMVCSLAMVLSTVMHPAIAGVLAYFSDLSWLMQYLPSEGPLYFVSMVLPSYRLFNLSNQFTDNALVLGWNDVGILTLYAVDLSVIFLLLAMWRIRYKEVN